MGILKGSILTTTPFTDISSDIYVPFPSKHLKTNIGSSKLFIITFTDRCTGYTRVDFITHIDSNTMLRAFHKIWLKDLPKPKTILSDNGSCYTSKTTKQKLRELGIKQKFTSPYNPTCNGISEKINSHIINVLRIYKNKSIPIIVKTIEKRINDVANTTVGLTPASLKEKFYQDNTFTLIRNNIRKSKVLNKSRKTHEYNIGDKILIRKQTKDKLDALYEGPFTIKAANGEQFHVEELGDKKTKKISNIKNIKPFIERGKCVDHTKYNFPPDSPPLFPPQIYKGKD